MLPFKSCLRNDSVVIHNYLIAIHNYRRFFEQNIDNKRENADLFKNQKRGATQRPPLP